VQGPGDAGLALGQAWIAAHRVAGQAVRAQPHAAQAEEELACA
jgi:hypothetical protein